MGVNRNDGDVERVGAMETWWKFVVQMRYYCMHAKINYCIVQEAQRETKGGDEYGDCCTGVGHVSVKVITTPWAGGRPPSCRFISSNTGCSLDSL
jgi:hypothetical protein